METDLFLSLFRDVRAVYEEKQKIKIINLQKQNIKIYSKKVVNCSELIHKKMKYFVRQYENIPHMPKNMEWKKKVC